MQPLPRRTYGNVLFPFHGNGCRSVTGGHVWAV